MACSRNANCMFILAALSAPVVGGLIALLILSPPVIYVVAMLVMMGISTNPALFLIGAGAFIGAGIGLCILPLSCLFGSSSESPTENKEVDRFFYNKEDSKVDVKSEEVVFTSYM